MKKEFGKWLMDIAKRIRKMANGYSQVSNDSCYIVIYYYRYG